MTPPQDHLRATPRPWWAVLTVWGVVNAVCLLQTAGFLTRPTAPDVNRVLGVVIVALAIPATAALVAFVRSGAGWRLVAGPLAFDAFVVLSLVVDYWLDIEFRDPREPVVLSRTCSCSSAASSSWAPRCSGSTVGCGR